VPRLPRVTAKQITAVLRKRGFELMRQSGSHQIYNKLDKRVTVPFHGATILHPKVLKSILRDADISIDNLMAEL
jgi:predicted RNA binding protein YcfA (HicA-like mRNA interferase family)